MTTHGVRLAEDRVPARVPYGFLALVVLFSAVLSVAAWLLLGARVHAPPAQAPPAINEVRQTLIRDERPAQRIFREQREALGRFGWVDREAGIVQIPVEDAARLIVEEAP